MTRQAEVLTTVAAAAVGALVAVLAIGARPVLALPGIAVVGLVALIASRRRPG